MSRVLVLLLARTGFWLVANIASLLIMYAINIFNSCKSLNVNDKGALVEPLDDVYFKHDTCFFKINIDRI